MADSPSNSLKRPHPDDLQNGGSAQKKIRSTNGSPAPQHNGVSAGKPDVSKIVADAKARAAAIAARMQNAGTKSNGLVSAPISSSTLPAASADGVGMSRAEQLKARVAAAMAKTSATSEQRTTSPLYQVPPPEDGIPRARGGLGIGLHPSLMESNQGSSKSKQAFQPRFATTMANRRTQSPADQNSKSAKAKKPLDLSGPSAEETRNNPYFDASLGGQTATLKSRNPKQLVFNQKGKFVAQANALRRQAALEQLKQRVAASSKKAGLEEDVGEKNFKIEEPPAIEWWDTEIVFDGKDYLDLDKAKIDTEGSIITGFLQHPVLIEPPSVKNVPEPRPLFLTQKEQAKLRRVNRMTNLKEMQAKLRLGLLPTPEPKVKIGNMLRVLGEEAVKDPTAVEARVNRQIAERKSTHEQMNADRKLTKEQKHEKLEQKQAQDAAKGIRVAIFKVDSLANGRHRFKVNKNAEQMGLSGAVICSPKQVLICAEAGQHSIRDFKKLLLNRIAWSENDIGPVREGNRVATQKWLSENEEDGSLKDLSSNHCTLIFEGETASRSWKKWVFRAVETDKEAMDALSRAKMENFWTQAKSAQ